MFNQKTEKRVAVFFAEGLEECEALIVTDILYRAGIPCDKVALSEDPVVISSHDVVLGCDRSISDEDFSFAEYDMLVLPGGMPGTTYLGDCGELTQALAEHSAAGKDLAAICAAPTVFAKEGLLKGKAATCYPGMEDMLVAGGATLGEGEVVIDGSVITSRGMGTAIEFGLTLVARIMGDEASKAVRDQIVYLH